MNDDILDAPDQDSKKTGEVLKTPKAIRDFRKNLLNSSQQLVDQGVEKAEIFTQAIDQHGSRYKKLMASIIGFTTTSEEKEKYRKFMYLLAILQAVILIFNVITIYNFYFSPAFSLLSLVLFSFTFIYSEFSILIGLLKNHYQFFISIMYFALIKIIFILVSEEILALNYVYIYLALTVISLILTLYLKNKIFPTLGLRGVKKDEFGNYRF